jgi:hypothetical protein
MVAVPAARERRPDKHPAVTAFERRAPIRWPPRPRRARRLLVSGTAITADTPRGSGVVSKAEIAGDLVATEWWHKDFLQ